MPSTSTDRLLGLTTSVAVKPACVAVATSNITLAGLQTINGVALAEGDRVLSIAQTNAKDNGIYNASTGTWTRAKDFDGARDAVQGTLVLVHNANVAAAIYELTTPNPVIFGTSYITFILRYGAQTPSYDQTQIEINLGIVPVDYSYPSDPVDPRRYGAKGDGIANDTVAVQTAMTLAQYVKGTVLVPIGIFLCDPLILTFTGTRFQTGWTMEGCGQGSIIRVRGTPTGTILMHLTSPTPTGGIAEGIIRLANFVLEKAGATACIGLMLDNVANVHLDNVHIRGFDTQLYLNSALIVAVRDCHFTDGNNGVVGRQNGYPGNVGVTAGSTVNLIEFNAGCRFNYNAQWGLDINHGTGWVVRGDIEANGTPGNVNTGGIIVRGEMAPDAFVAKVEIRAWIENNDGTQIYIAAPTNGTYLTVVIEPDTLLASESGRGIFIGGAHHVRIADLVCGPGEICNITAAKAVYSNFITDTLTENVDSATYENAATSAAAYPFGKTYQLTALTLTGVSSQYPGGEVIAIKQGNAVWLQGGNYLGVSNGAGATLGTLPEALRPVSAKTLPCVVQDNGTPKPAYLSISTAGVMTLSNGFVSTTFTGSGNKGLDSINASYKTTL